MDRPSKDPKQPSQANVPSYMAPTQSAKAKVRTQGAYKQTGPASSPWNNPSSTGNKSPLGPSGDTSSSASETATYRCPRSPNPSGNRGWARAQKNGAGYSPDSIGSTAHRMFGYGWKPDYPV